VEPVFVVGCARSGTTLLRVLLGSHPSVSAPAEADIPGLVRQVEHTWSTLSPGGAEPDATLQRAIRVPMEAVCHAEGTTVYCDKTPGAIESLSSLTRLLPEAKFVFLYRHPMDVVASVLDSSPWGFRGYDFAPYLERSPDNFVAGALRYWNGHVHRALAWQEQLGNRGVPVVYEELVSDPKAALADVWDLLRLPSSLMPTRPLAEAVIPGVLADYEIGFTDDISTDSVGAGRRVPTSMIPPVLLEATNGHLAQIGLDPLGDDWNSAAAKTHESALPPRRRQAIRDVAELLDHLGTHERFLPFRLVLDDCAERRWTVAPGAEPSAPAFTIVASAHALMEGIRAQSSVGELVRSGRVRYFGPLSEGEEAAQVAPAFALLRQADAARGKLSASMAAL
jgi:hypothetical protein